MFIKIFTIENGYKKKLDCDRLLNYKFQKVKQLK